MLKQFTVHWNDFLAFAFLAGILAGWYTKLLPSELNSAAVAWVALVLQFYFRKAPPTSDNGQEGGQ